MPETSTVRSQPRGADPAKRHRLLRGDLDNIVLKSLRKEPQSRYGSVEQMAEDIRRHLGGLPVIARGDSLRYRATKFVTRHKLGVAASAIALLTIVAGIVATVREARIAAENGRRAEQRFNEVRKLANSLMFEIHDSVQSLPGTAGARQLIVQRSQEYLDSLAKEAFGDISLQRELATAYDRLGTLQGTVYESSIGDVEAAKKSLQKAVAIREEVAAANHQNTEDQIALARACEQLGRAQWLSSGGDQEALQTLKRAVAIAEEQNLEHPGKAEILEVLARGYEYLGDLEGGSGLRGGTAALADAQRDHEKALLLFQQMADASPNDMEKKYLVARAQLGVGDDYLRAANAAQALNYFQEARSKIAPEQGDPNNPKYRRALAICETRMGDALLMIGRAKEALAHYQKEEALLGPLAASDPRDVVAHATLVTSQGDVGHALVESGQVSLGTKVLQRALADTIRVAGTANDSYARTLVASTNGLVGEAVERGGNARAAVPYYERALALYAAAVKADPADLEDAVNVLIMRNHLGRAELRCGMIKAAGEQYSKGLAATEELMAASSENVEVLYAVADTYTGMGDWIAKQKPAITMSEPPDRRDPIHWYSKSLSVWQKVPHNTGPVSPNGFEAGNPHEVLSRLRQLGQRASSDSSQTTPDGHAPKTD